MKVYMKEYDFERIKECVNMEDICDMLGIEKRRIGNLTSILCPFHDDQHFGNAFIMKNNRKIICYACGKTADIFDLYMYQTGLTLQEAAAEISEKFGLSDVTVQKRPTGMPFSREELAAIGLLCEDRKPERYPVSVLDTPEKRLGYTVSKETTLSYSRQTRQVVAVIDDYVVSKKGQPMYKHLVELYESDKSTFYWMVRNKCREYYKYYNTTGITLSVLLESLPGACDGFLKYQMDIVFKKLALIESAYKKTKKRKYPNTGRKIA